MRLTIDSYIPNTFGIKAKARKLVVYDNEHELACFIRDNDEPKLCVGLGANLLLTKDYKGAILISNIKGLELLGDGLVRIGSGELWDDIVERTISCGLCGLEKLSLIPSTIGAAAIQNIGAYGFEAKDFIKTIEAIDLCDGSKHVFENEQCEYGYRTSIFKTKLKGLFAVTHVTMQLSFDMERKQEALKTRSEIIAIRQNKLPDVKLHPNAGSFFVNPIVERRLLKPEMPFYEISDKLVKIPAAWLIEQAGYKGKALGKAAVSGKHALVVVNYSDKADDVIALSEAIQKDVLAMFDIQLKPEVQWI